MQKLASIGLIAFAATAVVAEGLEKKKHHKKHHHKKHHKQEPAKEEAKEEAPKDAAAEKKPEAPKADAAALEKKIQSLAKQVQEQKPAPHALQAGKIDVNGPLPATFRALFAQSAGKAIPICGQEGHAPKVIEENVVGECNPGQCVIQVVFEAPVDCVHAIQHESAEATSAFVNGPMYDYLVAKTSTVEAAHTEPQEVDVNVDTEMPFGTLEPFGREDTAEELTDDSIHESDAMVDQMEKAEVAEEKRSVFRALTRLRGAAITSFDGVARSQTGNIDEYNKMHKWRSTHPLHHLAAEEGDAAKWAFPDHAD